MIVVETSTSASPAQERVHLLLELALAHLPVGDDEPQPGHELLQLLGRGLDRLDAVVEVEALAAALVLALERELHELLVVLADRRPDRPAALRRRLDDRDVAQARERHVQRARDRRRREREHVDLEAQRPQELLLRDAEALLLVEDHEAEILRDHVAREQAVRADEDVDLARLVVGEHLLDLLRRPEAGDHLDTDREVAEAVAEGVPVLLGEDRRRHEHQHLLPVHRDGEGGPHRHLGLAEADVAADEPVHRAAAPRGPPSRPRSRAAGRRSRGTGRRPRSARATRWRGRRRPRAPAGAARRGRSARRRARAPTRARGSAGSARPCRRASRARAPSRRRRCSARPCRAARAGRRAGPRRGRR